MENYITKNSNLLEKIDNTLVNLINEGRNFLGIRNKILSAIENKDRILITTNYSEYLELRNMFPDCITIQKRISFGGNAEKEERERYSVSWFWVIKDNYVKSGTSGWGALEHTMDNHPSLPVVKIKYNKY